MISDNNGWGGWDKLLVQFERQQWVRQWFKKEKEKKTSNKVVFNWYMRNASKHTNKPKSQ